MNLVTGDEEGVFRRLLEAYFGCYMRRDLIGLRALHVTDGDFVHFDHDFDRDASGLSDFLKKTKRGFDQDAPGAGEFTPVEVLDFKAYADRAAGLMVAVIRRPKLPNVLLRATFVLSMERGAWRFRHVHVSQDPNTLAELAVAS